MLRTFLDHVRKFGWSGVQGKSNSKCRRRANRTLEKLEVRALLATFVNSTTLTYQDIDGDRVTVAFSKPILSQSNVNSIFTFSPLGTPQNNNSKQQLQSINLANIAAAAGTTITTTAVRSSTTGGDGFAAVGQINATGRDLGNVTIDGDLGRILAGNAITATPGLGALVVHSMGRFGTFTGAADLHSIVQGKLTSLKTKTDIVGAFIDVQGGVNGKLDSVIVGGSVIGDATFASGVVFSTGDMGPVTVAGDLIGSTGTSSGQIATNGKLTSVTIGGNVLGASGSFSGWFMRLQIWGL